MAILVTTLSAEVFLKKIRREIDLGNISTWNYNREGDFTFSSEQWKGKGFFRPEIGLTDLRFQFMRPHPSSVSDLTLGVFHGGFITMLITHFQTDFVEVCVHLR